jgi:hypothetical protein
MLVHLFYTQDFCNDFAMHFAMTFQYQVVLASSIFNAFHCKMVAKPLQKSCKFCFLY